MVLYYFYIRSENEILGSINKSSLLTKFSDYDLIIFIKKYYIIVRYIYIIILRFRLVLQYEMMHTFRNINVYKFTIYDVCMCLS